MAALPTLLATSGQCAKVTVKVTSKVTAKVMDEVTAKVNVKFTGKALLVLVAVFVTPAHGQ